MKRMLTLFALALAFLPLSGSVAITTPPSDPFTHIVISAVGDCTLGANHGTYPEGTLPEELLAQNGDYGYFFRAALPYLEDDDLTIANLEGALTDYDQPQSKTFRFKGPPAYTQILTQGSIEAVTLANNHSMDYGVTGFEDTVRALNQAGIIHFGGHGPAIFNLKGITVGLLGYSVFNQTTQYYKDLLAYDIASLKQAGTGLIIVSMHGGQEGVYSPTTRQQELARYAIDQGADLVLGHHPHVLQGIEQYQGKTIVYSLGNFVFGGNRNPNDKDTMIFQQSFSFEEGQLVATDFRVIPMSLSSQSTRNDYQPTPLVGSARKLLLDKTQTMSDELGATFYLENHLRPLLPPCRGAECQVTDPRHLWSEAAHDCPLRHLPMVLVK